MPKIEKRTIVILTVVGLIFILIGLPFAKLAAAPTQNNTSMVIVYYFHRTVRCPSCTMLEELTRDAVETGFARELENGELSMQAINVDEKDNEYFVDDYHLSVQSVVLSQVEHGKEKRWKHLDRVWTLMEDQDQLLEYLQKEIRSYLTGTQKITGAYTMNSVFHQD